MTVGLRSRLLLDTFGVEDLSDIDVAAIDALVASGVEETELLEFKRDLYGGSDSDKREFATDVAALANRAGGLMIIGVAEGDGAAIAAEGVAAGEPEVLRLRQIMASLVAPLPRADIWTVSDSSKSFLLIAVQATPAAPFAVVVGDGFRFPVRHGTTTRYLAEHEVAAAYLNRGRSIAVARESAIKAEAAAIKDLDVEKAWLLVSLTPESPGDRVLDHAEYVRTSRRLMGGSPLVIGLWPANFYAVQVGPGRFRALGTPRDERHRREEYVLVDYYRDGSGVMALRLPDLNERHRAMDPGLPCLVIDEQISLGIVSGVRHLAAAARDLASCGGQALVRVRLHAERPLQIGHTRGFGDPRGYVARTGDDLGEATAELGGLLEGSDIVGLTANLADELGQCFGVTEMGQFDRSGRVRRKYWSADVQAHVRSWAEGAGITVTDDVLPQA